MLLMCCRNLKLYSKRIEMQKLRISLFKGKINLLLDRVNQNTAVFREY
jgi:hypothetical protein